MRLRERARIELTVQRVSWWLDWWHMPGRRRRDVRRELRAGLADAAGAGDLHPALGRLGTPKEVAAAYLEGEGTGVRWRAGLLAGLITLAVVTFVVQSFMVGFSEGVRAVGGEVGQIYETGRSLTVLDTPLTSFRKTDDGFMVSGSMLTWPQVIAFAAAFVAFSRPWRALRRPRRETAPR